MNNFQAFTYVSGPQTAVVVWPVGVLIDLPSDDAIVTDLYAALAQAPTAETAMDALTANGLAKMADFGIIAVDGANARLAVHGGTVAELTGVDDAMTSSGGLTDRTVGIDTSPLLRGATAGDEIKTSPIRDGIVAASRLALAGADIGSDAGAARAMPNRADDAPVAPDDAVPADNGKRAMTMDDVAEPTPAPEPIPEPIPAPEPIPEPAPDDRETTGFEHLFGQTTRFEAVEDIPPAPEPTPMPATPSLGATQAAPSTMSFDSIDELDVQVDSDGAIPDLPPTSVEVPPPLDGSKPFIASFDWMNQPPPPPAPAAAPAAANLAASLPPPPPPPAAAVPAMPMPTFAAPNIGAPPPPPPPAAAVSAMPMPTFGAPNIGAPPPPPPAPSAMPMPTFAAPNIGAPPPPPPAPSAAPLDNSPDIDDFGGHTIRRPAASSTGDIVAAVYCPAGHLNPPFADRCRICQAPIAPQQPVQVPRPPLGVLRLANNLVLTLDRGAVLGRNPRVIPGEPGPQPNLVRLNDPNKDISSAHLEVRLEGWYVTVRDLNSTNGTQVILPGHAPVTLRPNEPMTLEPGARVVLAQVFDFVYEPA